jgi:hypothetical protein
MKLVGNVRRSSKKLLKRYGRSKAGRMMFGDSEGKNSKMPASKYPREWVA